MSNILDTAKLAIDQGLCVVPPREDGTKAPDAPSWKEFQARRPTRDELNAWYRGGKRHGIGLVCGDISGGLELFEFEALAVTQGLVEQWGERMRDIGAHDLLMRLADGYTESSASGGLHFLYRCDTTRTEKLASTPEHRTLIETKGEGGYCIIAPSHGPVAPGDGRWEVLSGSLATIPTITPDERATIHRIARTLDQSAPTIDSRYTRPPSQYDTTTPSPLDLYRDDPNINQRTIELLERHGWTRAGQTGDTTYMRRPGKQHGISATIGHVGPGVTTIFTTSTTLDARTYSPGDLYAHLEHHGDLTQATRALREHGYAPPIDQATPIIQRTAIPGNTQEHADHDPELTSWEPVDLTKAWAGDILDEPPTILQRNDGVALVYPGKVNTFQGESESMKTWAALCATQETLARGQHVIYIDFEDSPTSIIERLRLLGVTVDMPFTYLRPDQPFTYAARQQIDDLLNTLAPIGLVILDGVTEAMTLEGLDLMSNGDIARWMKTLPRWIARHQTAPAVITIDHVPKNPDARGKGALGGQHKRAGIDGIGLTFTVTSEPLARGRDGRARITIDKDRPGHARAHQGPKSWIGDLVITHANDGHLAWEIQPPAIDLDAEGQPKTRREDLADTILAILSEPYDPTKGLTAWSIRKLSEQLRAYNHSHRDETIRNTLEMLAREGIVTTVPGANGYPTWTLAPVDNLL